MDFRSRNPNLQIWPYSRIRELSVTKPYGNLEGFSLFDLWAFDGTPYLAVFGDFTKDPGSPYLYALDLTDTS